MRKINARSIEKIENGVKEFATKFNANMIAEIEASNDEFRINSLRRLQNDNQKAVEFLASIESAERVSETDDNDITKTFVLVSDEVFEIYDNNF